MMPNPLRIGSEKAVRTISIDILIHSGLLWHALQNGIKGASNRIHGSGKHTRMMTLDKVDVEQFADEHENDEMGAALLPLLAFNCDQYKFVQGWED